MPEIHIPSPTRVQALGPASALANNATVRRRRRRGGMVKGTPAAAAAASPSDMDFELTTKTVTPGTRIPALKLKSTAVSSSRKKHQRKRVGKRVFPHVGTPYNSTLPRIPFQSPLAGANQASAEQTPAPSPPKHPQAPPLAHVRRALLVDTRTIDTNAGRVIGENFLDQTRGFLTSLRRRGMAPYLLTGLTLQEATATPRARRQMVCQTLRVLGNTRMTVSVDCFCQALLIQPALNSGNILNTQAIKVPTRLLANASWNLFGDLVEEATTQDTKSSPVARKVPLSVTLLTNDMALLCDSDMDAHKEALTKFWNRVRPSFHKNLCKVIEIVVVDTGTVQNEKDTTNDMSSTVSEKTAESERKADDTANTATEDEEHAEATAVDTITSSQREQPSGASNAKAESKPLSRVARFVERIREFIATLADADYKVDRSREDAVNPVSISISLVDNSHRGFGGLGRRWMSQLISPVKGSLSFELPETMDGTQCSISLDVRYRLMPYPANSYCAAGMLADLQLLASSTVEAVQLVPVSCVDANLIFGVSMEVLPGFENDEGRFQEMKALVYLLLKQLRDNDVALLLRAENDAGQSEFGPPLHHSHHQTYLLMAQDFPDLSPSPTSSAPFEASLFRYGTADQMLSVGSSDLYTPQVDDETLSQLRNYVDSSLEMLPNGVVNPVVNDEVRIMNEMEKLTVTEEQDENMEDVVDEWNDTMGVGSRATLSQQVNQDGNGESTPVQHTDKLAGGEEDNKDSGATAAKPKRKRKKKTTQAKSSKEKENEEGNKRQSASASSRRSPQRRPSPKRNANKQEAKIRNTDAQEEVTLREEAATIVEEAPESNAVAPAEDFSDEISDPSDTAKVGLDFSVESREDADMVAVGPNTRSSETDAKKQTMEGEKLSQMSPKVVLEGYGVQSTQEFSDDISDPSDSTKVGKHVSVKSKEDHEIAVAGPTKISPNADEKKQPTEGNSSQKSLDSLQEVATEVPMKIAKGRQLDSDDSDDNWKEYSGVGYSGPKSASKLSSRAVKTSPKGDAAGNATSSDEELFETVEKRDKTGKAITEADLSDDTSDSSDDELLQKIRKARVGKRNIAAQLLVDTDTESEAELD